MRGTNHRPGAAWRDEMSGNAKQVETVERRGVAPTGTMRGSSAEKENGRCRFRFLDPTLSESSLPLPGIECQSEGATRLPGFSPGGTERGFSPPPGSDLLARRTNLLSPSVTHPPVFKVAQITATKTEYAAGPRSRQAASPGTEVFHRISPPVF